MQVTGITAGATRIATIPDANYSVARIDAAQTFTGTQSFELITGTMTSVSATPGTSRAIYGKYTTFTSMTSGNLVGTRGEVTMGGNVTGTAFLYGAQGKIITGANTINVGSSYVAGVFGQLDLTGATVTSGYVCGVASDIFGVSSGTVAADLFYGQHADGGTINSYFRAYGKATSVFEFDTNSGTQITSTGTASTPNGHMVVKVNGVSRYLQLYDTP
jgi:hypothetical protein